MIGTYAELADARLEGAGPLQDALREVQAGVRRAHDLARLLLPFGRPPETRYAPFDLNALVERLSKVVRLWLGETTELSLSLDPDLLPIEGAPGDVDLVLIAMVSAARDASPEMKVLHLETLQVESPLAAGAARSAPHAVLVAQARDGAGDAGPAAAESIESPVLADLADRNGWRVSGTSRGPGSVRIELSIPCSAANPATDAR